ncbi:MAG: hypothetical protein [Caudoviricetes sp.]|jgi:hypothetical protein|nr:MAG: hypothetical protein [Caudoviricetes sp.]
MTVRALDSNGDIVTSGVQFITGQDEVGQTIQTRLRLYLGEYFRDITDGTPWFQQILGKATNMNAREAALRQRIAGTPGVIRLASFSADFDIDSKTYTVSASVITKYGLTEVTVDG